MSDLPKVTAIIAVHNCEKYIQNAISSIYKQTYPNMSLVICDDGSTDSTLDKIKEATENAKFDTHVNVLPTCTGASTARNVAIRDCIENTDYILIQDSDDESYPNKVATMMEKASRSNQIGVVYADYHILNTKTGNIIHESKRPYDAPQ